ncbi:glycosyltransferase 87 family protein [Gellertiella hungarica]|uniref:DUF2029 domain-containing protein n=1 Tax=Gellertiella hungarica TaxID=1572859 RepID=A0A7W6NN18_9HYPH|nr:hypothetical protein [Gellertiella hungarica]
MEKSLRGIHGISGACVFLFGLILAATYFRSLWTLDADGISMLNQKLPYWDFSNLWAGGHLAGEGRVHTLFDVEAYRAALRQLFTPVLQDQEWSYPPSLLLLGVPLGWLPVLPAYVLWTAGTLLLLYLALRPFRFPLPVTLAVILSPAAMINVLLGQNGALTAALLLGGLWALGKKPWIAGLFFGILTIKPHLGFLIPVVLLAGGHWRAIAAAVLTTLVLVAVTGLLFGWQVWFDFRTVTLPLMAGIMEAPYPQPYHANAMTVFIMARWLDASVGVAQAIQIIAGLVAAGAAFWLWRPAMQIDPARRIVLTAMLVIFATPYGYSYDAVALAPAVAWGFLHERRIPLIVHAIVWLFPLFVHVINLQGIGASVMVPLAYTAWHFRLVWQDTRQAWVRA